MHPRLAVHEICFPDDMDTEAILAWAAGHDIPSVGLFSQRHRKGWDREIANVANSTTSIAYLCHSPMFNLDDPSTWDASTQKLKATVDAACAMGTSVVYTTTGPTGRLEFEEAVDALCCAIVPARTYAAARGIKLLTETTYPTFRFAHFLHTFQDTVDVAAAAGIGVCLDLHPTWHERGLRQRILSSIAKIDLVQVADQAPRNMTMARDVVGEGIVPIEGLLALLFEAGYDGRVDLELLGRPQATMLDDILRSAERLSTILTRIGA
jgi:sugar phosphate isomerase/epimerase